LFEQLKLTESLIYRERGICSLQWFTKLFSYYFELCLSKICKKKICSVLAVDDRHVAFCEYNGSVARIICVAVATLANEKLLEHASDNDLLLCRKSTSNKTRYRQWFDRCIISKMILKSESNWLFPVFFSVEITLSGSYSGNNFKFSYQLTGFLNYALFCLSFCLRLNLTPVNYLTRRLNMAKRQGSILSFFGNVNGPTQQKTTKSYEY
jgi:hypothetical protein